MIIFNSVTITAKANKFYYELHPDYRGSVEWITDMRGNPYQFMLNNPWGESLVEKRVIAHQFDSRFRFNLPRRRAGGKELDPETGNYYYGARYYDPKVSVWLSVDPKAHWYPGYGPYNFSLNNPVNLVDPNGMWVEGGGFLNNLFLSDEKVVKKMAHKHAKKIGGEVISINGGYRVSATQQGDWSGKTKKLGESYQKDYYVKGKQYSSFVSMVDAKFKGWMDRNMRSGLSSWNRIAEPLDRNAAPKIAREIGELNNTFNPVMSAANGGSSAIVGQDLWGNKKEGVYERGIRPAISIFSFGGGLFNANKKLLEGAQTLDVGIGGVETIDRWLNPDKGSIPNK